MNAATIMSRLGGHRTGKTFMCRCPTHADRTASLAVRDFEGGVLVHCHAGCPQPIVIDELKRLGLWPEFEHDRPVQPRQFVRSPDQDDAARTAYAQDIWNAAVDPRGTLAERYLRSRDLKLDDAVCMRTLRFHPRCPFGKDEAGNRLTVPALVAAFRPMRNSDEDQLPRAIHRIGLTPDGRKLEKKMLGPTGGCAIKLDPDDMVHEGLGICEGIETGLAIRKRPKRPPIWALGNAGAIRLFEPLPGIAYLTVFADHDNAGMNAACECAQRWTDAGHESIVRYLKHEGLDYADA